LGLGVAVDLGDGIAVGCGVALGDVRVAAVVVVLTTWAAWPLLPVVTVADTVELPPLNAFTKKLHEQQLHISSTNEAPTAMSTCTLRVMPR